MLCYSVTIAHYLKPCLCHCLSHIYKCFFHCCILLPTSLYTKARLPNRLKHATAEVARCPHVLISGSFCLCPSEQRVLGLSLHSGSLPCYPSINMIQFKRFPQPGKQFGIQVLNSQKFKKKKKKNYHISFYKGICWNQRKLVP